MTSKFRRAKSMEPWFNNLSRKNITMPDEISILSQNTIIPFINQRYSIIQKPYQLNVNCSQIQNKINSAAKISCRIIISRLERLVMVKVGSKLIMHLKQKKFIQKLQNFINIVSRQQKSQAFETLKLKKVNHQKSKAFQTLLCLDFLLKKKQHNQLSFAFRKIILFPFELGQFKADRMLQTHRRKKIDQQQITKNQRQNSQRTMKPTYSSSESFKSNQGQYQRNLYQLKPDSYKNHYSKNLNFWKLSDQVSKIQN